MHYSARMSVKESPSSNYCLRASLVLLLLLAFGGLGYAQTPSLPAWPDKFNIDLKILVEEYGESWSSIGKLYYDYNIKTFRADYIDWCLPLFDSGPADKNNYTCSFLATQGNMYFVNHTSHAWQEYQCCVFAPGLAAVPPDWMKNCQYNGTTTIDGVLCDVWWFPGTKDPNKPCYGYWSAREDGKTPVRFFGLSSVGPTILDYSNFKPGDIPPDVPLSLPNTECKQECKPPLIKALHKSLGMLKKDTAWPMPWPSCE